MERQKKNNQQKINNDLRKAEKKVNRDKETVRRQAVKAQVEKKRREDYQERRRKEEFSKVADLAAKKAQERAEKARLARISRPKKANPKATTSEATKKQLPLLNEEKSSLYNNLNKMSQEQLRKYVSTFNNEARIVGGHKMGKVEIINAIINKAKTIDSLLKKLRVEKIDTQVAGYRDTGTRGVAIDKTGTKTRETEPKKVDINETTISYKRHEDHEGHEGFYLKGYVFKPVSANRFKSFQGAKNVCDKNGNCFGITKEVVKGETFYTTRANKTPIKKTGSGQVSWIKQQVTPIKLKEKK